MRDKWKRQRAGQLIKLKDETIQLFWMRPRVEPSPREVEAYLKTYAAAEGFEARQKLVDDWLGGGAIYIGYTLPGSSALLAAGGTPSRFTIQAGDVSYAREDFQNMVDAQNQPVQ